MASDETVCSKSGKTFVWDLVGDEETGYRIYRHEHSAAPTFGEQLPGGNTLDEARREFDRYVNNDN